MSETEAEAVPEPMAPGAGGVIPTVGDSWKALLSNHPTMAHQAAHAIRIAHGEPGWEQLVASLVEMDSAEPPASKTIVNPPSSPF